MISILALFLLLQGSGLGVYNTTSLSYNDGNWHFLRVFREGNVATLEDDSGHSRQVRFGEL